MSCFLGIDPGVAGGLALIAQDGQPLTALKMPATERELCDVVYQLAGCDELRGMIEKLGAMPRRSATVRCAVLRRNVDRKQAAAVAQHDAHAGHQLRRYADGIGGRRHRV